MEGVVYIRTFTLIPNHSTWNGKKPKSQNHNVDKTLFTLHQRGHQVNEPLFWILCLWRTNERTENNRWVRLNSTERKNSSQDSTQCLVSPVESAWTCKVLVCEMDPPSHRQIYSGTTFSEETARLTGLRCGSDWWTTHERDNRTLPITQQLKASSTNRLWNNAKHKRGLCVWHGRKGQLGRHSWTLRPKTKVPLAREAKLHSQVNWLQELFC